MNYYQDLTLIDNTEISLGFIWQKVFQQIHIALVENGYEYARRESNGSETILRASKVAVSFPCYGDKTYPLGNKLRLLAHEQEFLEGLSIEKCLSRLRDYVQISPIEDVPDLVSYVGFSQKRVKGRARLDSSLRKKARHIHEKFGADFQQTLNDLRRKSSFEESVLPFVHVESQSSEQDRRKPRFKLFIEKHEYTKPEQGEFDCYGLSKNATIPWF